MCFGSNEKGGAYTKDMKYFDDNNKMKYLAKKSLQKYPALSKALKLVSLESKKREGKTRNNPVKGKKKQNKPGKIHNAVLENVNKTQTQTNKSGLVEMEQEETQVISEENTEITETEELNTEQSNETPKEVSENNNTSFDENAFNYEIKIENVSASTTVDENIDIEEDEEIQNTSTGTQTKEQNGFDTIQSSSQTIIKEAVRNKESNPSSSCSHDSCGSRNPEETEKMTVKITIKMSEATYAQFAPMIPETCHVTRTSVPH